MDWLARLKKESVKKLLPISLILIALGIAMFILSGAYRVFSLLTPKTLTELTPDTAEGAYVVDDVYFLYGEFIEEEQYKNDRPTGTITSRYYLTDFDEDTYFMGLRVYQEDLDDAEDMMDACDAYMDDELDASQVPILHVRGTIRAMDDEERGYYYDAVDNDRDMTDVMLPFYLDMGRVGGLNTPALVIVLVFVLFLVGIGAGTLIYAAAGGYQKQVRQMLQASGSFDLTAEKAAAFYDSTEPVSKVRMGKEFVCFNDGPRSVLLRPWDIAWAYQSTTTHRRGLIVTGKTHAVVLRLMDGKRYDVTMSEQEAQTLLSAMQTALPGVVLGYDKNIEQMYNRQRDFFAQRWQSCLNGEQAEPARQTAAQDGQ